MHASTPHCFIDPVYTQDQIQVMQDIQYGSAYNHKTQQEQDLMLDAYLPPDSDKRDKRPVVVVMHGGGFTDGDKQDDGQVKYAYELSKRGYAVVSINYRLTGDSWSWESEKEIFDAQEDFRAAIRYVRSVADDYRLDSDMIIVSGDSAGADTALFLSYAKEAQYEGDSGNPGFPSNSNGVISISGEMKGEAYCSSVDPKPSGCQIETGKDETNDIGTFNNQPPLVMIHGDKDMTVPYVNGKAVFERAQSVGLPSQLITMPGLYHVPWDDIFNTYFTDLTTSIYQEFTKDSQAPEGC